MSDNKQSIIVSGVQSTGALHLGNYLGAIKNWAAQQKTYKMYIFVADLHAFTVPEAIRPEKLRASRLSIAATYIAAGMDPSRATIFCQSDVPEHSYAGWLMTCVTPMGWLERMTQFKSKLQAGSPDRDTSRLGTGLFAYPCLQAADIVLYDADFVPTGEDQRQHLELTRDLVQRFNFLFGDCLVTPNALVGSVGSRIMGLDDPNLKMSKSIGAHTPNHAIWMLDSADAIRKKFRKAQTDLGAFVTSDYGSGIRNLLQILAASTQKTEAAVLLEFEGKQYSKLKDAAADAVIELLKPIQEQYGVLMDNTDEIARLLASGAHSAQRHASRTLLRMRSAVGL